MSYQETKQLLGARDLKGRLWYPNVEKMVYFDQPFIGLDCKQKWKMMLSPVGQAVYMGESTFMEFTGQTDSEGYDLYKGDIIEGEYGWGLIILDQTTQTFKYDFGSDRDDLWLYAGESKHLGNVFENPKLMGELLL